MTEPGSRDLPAHRTLAELVSLLDLHDELYVRYSFGPDEDRGSRSVDYESGLELPGLSCNPLTVEPWWTLPRGDWLARKLVGYAWLHHGDHRRFGWLLTGRVTGRGPDNEPLLSDWTAVGRLDPTIVHEAEQRYRERFDRGRDSLGRRTRQRR